MKKSQLKKIMKWTLASFTVLVLVLCIHIYWVTRPKAPDAHTIVMARIDFKQSLTQADASNITAWLYAQHGVSHVLCNPTTRIAVFTFFPIQNSANKIISGLVADTHYKAVRFMPSEEDMKAGCPVAATSFTYKAYAFVKHIF